MRNYIMGTLLAVGLLLGQSAEGKDKTVLSEVDTLKLRLIAEQQSRLQTIFSQLTNEGQKLSAEWAATQKMADEIRKRVCEEAKVPYDECSIPPDFSKIVRVTKAAREPANTEGHEENIPANARKVGVN